MLPPVRRRPWSALFALLATAALRAQVPAGIGPPADATVLDATPPAGSPAAARWQAGRDAMHKGDAAGAVPHLLAALEFHPDSPPVLLDLATALADADGKSIWLERFVRAAADAQGHLKTDSAQQKLLAGLDLKGPQKLAELRAQAAAELVRALDALKPAGKGTLGNGALARWYAETFMELAGDAPALLQKHGPPVAAALQRGGADWDLIAQALLDVVQRGVAPHGGRTDGAPAPTPELAQRAARILAGLFRQTNFGKDLLGPPPPPDLGKIAAAAAAAIAPAGDPAAAAQVWSIAELEQLDKEQRDQFTLTHRSWQSPGVTLSPNGRYRVETVCGFETLLGAAKTVEFHHARLAAHYGRDPFLERQGTLRIVPEAFDLEREGAPFWWAAGFQGGDRTVVRFAWGTIPDLGHLLTHELTHRFDGMLRPFLGSWYGEGHASWTAAHYAAIRDPACVEDFLANGTVAHSAGLGYGSPEKLTQLLTGKIEDYRDNYPVGYSLYAFLRGWPPKAPPRYRSALERFEQNARAGVKDPLAFFTATFCDGKDGRPRDFAGFVAEWQAFLDGCARWQDPKAHDATNAWVGRYGGLGDGDPAPMVMDEPTWSWARDRAEPFFGQGHAAAAGDVLAAAGLGAPATAAWLASLACEGWSAHAAFAAAEQLQHLGRPDAAAALCQLAAARFPAEAPAAQPTPLLPQLRQTKLYFDALQQQAGLLRQGGREVAAAALFAEHERLATRLGLPPAAGSGTAEPIGLPPVPVPRALGGLGFVEDALTGYDKERSKGFWYPTPEGDLHVGREKPKESTGALDRAAHSRLVFVRSSEWLAAGDYVVRMRIHFTTAFVSGAVVLGHWRRDRDLRLSFAAGDYEYAVGRREQNDSFRSVQLSLRGLWERDPHLSNLALPHELKHAAAFDLELHVRGPSVQVIADGEPQFRYTTHDGSPIEGWVGFAMDRGAIRVQQPTVQRLDTAQPGQARAAVEAIGLDLERQPDGNLEDLLQLRTRGIPTGPVGTLVLWLPQKKADDAPRELGRYLPVLAKLLKDRVEFPQEWRLAAPAGTPKAELDAVAAALAEFRAAPIPLLEHHVGAPFTGVPWLLFVDAQGCLRAAAEIGDASLYTRVQKWARMFRAR